MKRELSDTELETYSRQIALQDIDYEGQLRLRNGSACIVGLGGLGSAIALKLTAMGIGSLRLVDRDIVSRSDLHRQYLYDVDSVGLPKVEVAARKLALLNPDVQLDPIPESFSPLNAQEVLAGVDVVLDGLDRPEPRYLLNRSCQELRIPYIFGAAIEVFGNVTTMVPGRTMCLECFMPGLKDEDLPKCAVVGVHPSILGIVTAIQTLEAVRVIIGQEPMLLNKLLYVDLREMKFHTIDIDRLEECTVCGTSPKEPPAPLRERFFEETCARDGRRNFVISPAKRIEVDLQKLPSILRERGFRLKNSGELGVTFEHSQYLTASLLKSGAMIAQASPKIQHDPRRQVLDTYKSILVEGLGFSPDILPKEETL